MKYFFKKHKINLQIDKFLNISKESIKLIELLDSDISRQQLYDITHNITHFRSYVNG